MPTSNVKDHLSALYANSDDPWNTHSSSYERLKFAQTVASLPRPNYRRGLEVGCGAGALTAMLAPRCERLFAMDCTGKALAVARSRASLANVTFLEGAAPGIWPPEPPDLVVLSEVLYFMTDTESVGLSDRLSKDCEEDCDVLLVNWLGDTGTDIGGAAAAERLICLLAQTHRLLASSNFGRFRMDALRRTEGPRVRFNP